MDFDVIMQLMTRNCVFLNACEENIIQRTGTGYKLYTDFKNDSDSTMKEFMCNIFSEFGTATRIITLIKLCFKRNIL